MTALRYVVLGLIVTALLGVPLSGRADEVVKPGTQQTAIEPGPAPPPSGPVQGPAVPSSGIFGLTLTQVGILMGVACVFVATAILMRWWLSEPATPEEGEAPTTPGPQDVLP